MIFYLEPKGIDALDYLSERGEFIGMLNSIDKDAKVLQKSDICLEKINENVKNNLFLICDIIYSTWQICIIANNADAFKEIKTKYKECQMLWYWLEKKYLKDAMPNMQYKEFLKQIS